MRRIIALILGAIVALALTATPAMAGGTAPTPRPECAGVHGTATSNLQCNADGTVTTLSPSAPMCVGGYFDSVSQNYVGCETSPDPMLSPCNGASAPLPDFNYSTCPPACPAMGALRANHISIRARVSSLRILPTGHVRPALIRMANGGRVPAVTSPAFGFFQWLDGTKPVQSVSVQDTNGCFANVPVSDITVEKHLTKHGGVYIWRSASNVINVQGSITMSSPDDPSLMKDVAFHSITTSSGKFNTAEMGARFPVKRQGKIVLLPGIVREIDLIFQDKNINAMLPVGCTVAGCG